MSEVNHYLNSDMCNKVEILKFQNNLLFYNGRFMPVSLFSLLLLPVHYSGKNLNNDKAPKKFLVAKNFLRTYLWSQLHMGKTQVP